MAMCLKKGNKGSEVKALQCFLGVAADGIFGSKTKAAVQAYQAKKGLTADGIAGTLTLTSIVRDAPIVRNGDTSKWAFIVEALVGCITLDCKIDSDDITKIKAFQLAHGLTADGIVGQLTWAVLFGIASSSSGKQLGKCVDYKQYDSRWASKVYTSVGNKSQTMKNSGCGATAAANVVATCKDSSVNPWTLAQLYMQHGFRTANSGTAWDAMKWTASRYGFRRFVQTSSFSTMRACIEDGGLVVVSFRPSKWTKAGHYCTLWKIDEKTVYVRDPASSSSSRAKGTYKEVQDAAKQYFCFYP